MKKILVLSLSATAVAFGLGITACGDSDDNGGGGAGGDGGAGGAGGTGGTAPAAAAMCVEECSAATDCDNVQLFNDVFCTAECASSMCGQNCCTADADCAPVASGWTTECTDDAGCTAGQVCIKFGDKMVCAMEKPAAGDCPVFADYAAKKAVDDSDVTVCAEDTYKCTNYAGGMYCLPPEADPDCTVDTDCSGEPMTKCVDGTCGCMDDTECTGPMTKCLDNGMCGCMDDTECTGNMTKCLDSGTCGCMDDTECSGATPTCYAQGYCGCGADTDCDAVDNASVCNMDHGVCECSAATDCTENKMHTGTTWVCE